MKLAAIFKDGMVLQRNAEVSIFGESTSEEMVYITIDDIRVEEKVNAGKWIIKLPPHAEGGPFEMKITSDNDEVIIRDILYGEVWLNNGQSNIELELKDCQDGPEIIQTANLPEIRYYHVPKLPLVNEELFEAEKDTCWNSITDKDFGDVSGIGYFYAKKLYEKLGVPIGMIDCYQGGSSITCWLEDSRLGNVTSGREVQQRVKDYYSGKTEAEIAKIEDDYNALANKFDETIAEATKKNPDISMDELIDLAGYYPWPPPITPWSMFRPSGLIESMLKRIVPYTIKGIVYYQGEEDSIKNLEFYEKTGKNEYYYLLLKELISQYRDLFGNKELPFIYFQLPMFIEHRREDLRDWATIREAQQMVEDDVKGAYLSSLIDLGEYNNVHPVDKETPGNRVSDVLFEKVYGLEGYHDMKAQGINKLNDKIYINLSGTYGEVRTQKNSLIDHRNETPEKEEADHIYGLEVRKEDGKWYVPKAHIDKETIVIEDADEIKWVRYGFFNYGKVNVYNKKGLPLRQFSIEVK